jgi:hypothetical protein
MGGRERERRVKSKREMGNGKIGGGAPVPIVPVESSITVPVK